MIWIMGMAQKKLVGDTLKGIMKRVALGVVDAVPVVGPNIKANIESDGAGQGNLDFLRLGVAVTTVVGVAGGLYLFATGKITFEQLESLINLLK